MRVYLAGPITGCTYGGCTDWRAFATVELADFTCLSPMRAKTYLDNGKLIDSHYDSHPNGIVQVLSGAKGIMTRDHWDCKRTDIILVNFIGATKVSIGTVMEVGWGHAYRHPVVGVMEPGNIHEHPMVTEGITHRVETLEDAITVVKALGNA